MSLEDFWYVAAWTEELGREPLQRVVLNRPIVLWRCADGTPAALDDICPHRSAPLSKGWLNGDAVVCAYHGLTFDREGRCTEVPGMTSVPSNFCTKPYPVAEKWGWSFVWMGDPAKADPDKIPDFHWMTSPDWAGKGERLPVAAHHSLLRDNLLDLTHAHYLHARSLATDAVIEFPIETRVADDAVYVTREMKSIETSPFFKRIGGFDGAVDHRQEIEFTPPSNVVIRVSVVDVANPDRRVDARVINVLTPETDRSTHYFWSVLRNNALDDDELTDWVFEAVRSTFDEDVDMIEAQQRMMDLRPDAPKLRWHIDKGIEQATRWVDRI